MDVLKQWVMVLLCTGFICSAVQGDKKTPGLKLVCSLAMLLALLWPIGRLKGMDFALPSLGEYKETVENKSEEYMEQVYKESAAIISGKAEEYISEQAALMGIECEAEVECQRDDSGVSYPVSAIIISSSDENDALLQLISTELGIEKEALYWKVKTNEQN